MNINVMKINMDVQEMRQSDIESVIGGNDYGSTLQSQRGREKMADCLG